MKKYTRVVVLAFAAVLTLGVAATTHHQSPVRTLSVDPQPQCDPTIPDCH
jgi:hypothetical protein